MTFEEMKQIKHCIYVYTDIRNGMQYIGQTNNLYRRDRDHSRGGTLFDNIYHAHPDCFKLEVIQEFAECVNIADVKNTAEIHYIAAWNTKWPNGYNMSSGGQYPKVHSWTGKQHTEEYKSYISELMTGEGNHQYGKTGAQNARSKPVCCVELNMTFESAQLATKWLRKNGWPNAAHSAISNCCNGKRNIAYGYHWEFIED